MGNSAILNAVKTCSLALALLWMTGAAAAPEFPKLTGRVVDTANMLSSTSEGRLTRALEGHERATSNQLVVVTVPNLQGYDIETYAYQLGRHWGVGQRAGNSNAKGEPVKDNGVLLIVAKEERKVRIEVGYGLEGELTDAISANIIQTVILPVFKRGQFERGIEAGTVAIVQALGGEYVMRSNSRASGTRSPLAAGAILLFMIASTFLGGGFGRRRRGFGMGLGLGMGAGMAMGSRSGGFGGGGFSGGGGGFGGGGASGGW